MNAIDAVKKVDINRQNELIIQNYAPAYRANFFANASMFPAGHWPGIAHRQGTGKGRVLVVVAPGEYGGHLECRALIRQAKNEPHADVVVLNRAAGLHPRITTVFSLTTQVATKGHFMWYFQKRAGGKGADEILRQRGGEGTTAILSAYTHPQTVDACIKAGMAVEFYTVDSGRDPRPELTPAECHQHTGPQVAVLASAGVVSAEAVEYGLFCGYDHVLCVGFDFSWHGKLAADPKMDIQIATFITHVVNRNMEGRLWNITPSGTRATWGGQYILTPQTAAQKFL